MRARTFFSRVSIEAGLGGVEEARQATTAVLRALRDRLTENEAEQAVAQLPTELKALWRSGPRPGRCPVKMHRAQFLERVRAEASLESARTAEAVTEAVFAALKEQISEGEVADIAAQLPRDLKAVWRRA